MTPKTYLYRAADADGKLLYVGVSSHPSLRLAQHSRTSGWHSQMENIEYFEYPNRSAAREAELAEIKMHRPPFNVVGNLNGTCDPAPVVQVNVTVPPGMRKDWKEAALHRNLTVNALVTEAVNAHLARTP